MPSFGINAGVIGVEKTASTSQAGGIWTTEDQVVKKRSGSWPLTSRDADFSNVSMLLHMDGTEGSTTFIDNSSYSHSPSTVVGAFLSTSNSRFGGSSLYIPSGSAYVEFASTTALQIGTVDHTIELFVYFPTGSAGGSIISKGNPYATADFAMLRYSDNEIYYMPGAVRSNCFADSWVHVAVSKSGTESRLFYNGILQDTDTGAPCGISNDPLLIGLSGWSGTGWGAPSGIYIDELRITKGVARYISDFTPPTQPYPNS